MCFTLRPRDRLWLRNLHDRPTGTRIDRAAAHRVRSERLANCTWLFQRRQRRIALLLLCFGRFKFNRAYDDKLAPRLNITDEPSEILIRPLQRHRHIDAWED